MPISIQLEECKFSSESESSAEFRISKAFAKYVILENEEFEAKTYADIVSLLSNKAVRILSRKINGTNIVFNASIENGAFRDIVAVESKFNKLLCIDSSFFNAFIDSSKTFNESLITKENNYSIAFVLLVFSLESISNILYRNGKWRNLKRFVMNYVTTDRFTQYEIREIEFLGKRGNTNLLFERLLKQDYNYRNDYVHGARTLPTLSQVADKMSMAFISNDQISIFPSHSWLRRISNIALNNFLMHEQCKGKNNVRRLSCTA